MKSVIKKMELVCYALLLGLIAGLLFTGIAGVCMLIAAIAGIR